MAKNERRGLGRGLGSLLPGSYDPVTPATPSPSQERVTIDREEIEEVEEEVVSSRVAEPAPVSEPWDEIVSEPIVRDVIRREVVETVMEKTTDEVDIDLISPNPDQPRTQFKKEEIEELASSIEKDGLLQPLLVRKMEDGTYQIIAGERRWQASKVAGLKQVPIRVKEADDNQALELALIENIQRSDLNPIEEAYGYRRLMERRSMTQAEVAQAVSKGRSTVANALRLLDLPEEAQQLLYEEKITAGHARAILSVPTQEGRMSLTNKIIENNMTVREAENVARLLSGRQESSASAQRPPMPQLYKSVAKTLRETLKTNVRVKSSKGKNKIEIEFKSDDDLQRLFDEIVSGIEKNTLHNITKEGPMFHVKHRALLIIPWDEKSETVFHVKQSQDKEELFLSCPQAPAISAPRDTRKVVSIPAPLRILCQCIVWDLSEGWKGEPGTAFIGRRFT